MGLGPQKHVPRDGHVRHLFGWLGYQSWYHHLPTAETEQECWWYSGRPTMANSICFLGLFLATAVMIGWFCISCSGRSEADQGPVEQGWLGAEGLQQVQAVVRCWGFQNMEIEVCLAGWAFHVLVKSALLIMLVFWQTKIHQNWKVEVHGHTCLSKSLCLGRFQRWGNMEQPWTKQACLSHTCVACVAAV